MALQQFDILKEITHNSYSSVDSNHQHYFVTGAAGTGKTELYHQISEELSRKNVLHYKADNINHVLRIFGITSCQPQLDNEFSLKITNDLKEYKEHKDLRTQQSKSTDSVPLIADSSISVLLIDNISIISADLFDSLDAVARYERQNDQPFGGLQLVMFGDFYQLAPLSVNSGKLQYGLYAFESNTWKRLAGHANAHSLHVRTLTENFRQEDPFFFGVLCNLRKGIVGNNEMEALDLLTRPKSNLTTHNSRICTKSVLKMSLSLQNGGGNYENTIENKGKNNGLTRFEKETEHVYKIKIKIKIKMESNSPLKGVLKSSLKDQVKNAFPLLPMTLRIYVGAPVLLIQPISVLSNNSNKSYAIRSGSVGTVTAFQSGYPIVTFECTGDNGNDENHQQSQSQSHSVLIKETVWQLPAITGHASDIDTDNNADASAKALPLVLCSSPLDIRKLHNTSLLDGALSDLHVDLSSIATSNSTSNCGCTFVECGMAYTMISRASDSDRLFISGLRGIPRSEVQSIFQPDQRVEMFYQNLK